MKKAGIMMQFISLVTGEAFPSMPFKAEQNEALFQLLE
jgi:hypothetical protein